MIDYIDARVSPCALGLTINRPHVICVSGLHGVPPEVPSSAGQVEPPTSAWPARLYGSFGSVHTTFGALIIKSWRASTRAPRRHQPMIRRTKRKASQQAHRTDEA